MPGAYSEDEFEDSPTTPRRLSTSSKESPISTTSTISRPAADASGGGKKSVVVPPKGNTNTSSIVKPKPKHSTNTTTSKTATATKGSSGSSKTFVGTSSLTHPKPAPAATVGRARASSAANLRAPAPNMGRRKSKEETLLEAAMAAHGSTSRRRASVNSILESTPPTDQATPLIKIDSSFVAFQSPKSTSSQLHRKSPITDNGSGSSPTNDTTTSPTKMEAAKPGGVKQTVRRLSAAGLVPAPGHDTPDGSGNDSTQERSTQPPEAPELDSEPNHNNKSPWQRDTMSAQFNLRTQQVDSAPTTPRNDYLDDRDGVEDDDLGAEQALFSFEEQMRHTPEYRVAWDLELWKAVQKRKAEKEVREFKKRLQDEARGTLLLQEKEIKKDMDKAMKELATRQKKIEEDEQRQEKRKVRLLEAEKELDRRMQALSDQRRRVEDDADARAKRLKAEYTHREEIVNSKLHQSEEALKRSDERLQVSQKEYMRLWEDFSAFKTRQLTERSEAPETAAMERMRQQHHFEMIQLNERLEREHRLSINSVIERLELSHQEVTKLSRMLTAQKERVRQLDHLNSQLSCQLEAQASSAHQQEQSFQRQLQDATHHNSRRSDALADLTSTIRNATNNHAIHGGSNSISKGGGGGTDVRITNFVSEQASQPIKNVSDRSDLHAQINLWSVERQRLLEMSGGAYTPKSDVIVALDRRIHHARSQLQV